MGCLAEQLGAHCRRCCLGTGPPAPPLRHEGGAERRPTPLGWPHAAATPAPCPPAAACFSARFMPAQCGEEPQHQSRGAREGWRCWWGCNGFPGAAAHCSTLQRHLCCKPPSFSNRDLPFSQPLHFTLKDCMKQTEVLQHSSKDETANQLLITVGYVAPAGGEGTSPFP